MHQTHFDHSLNVLASSTGRRDAVRSLGAIGTALLAALGFADASVAAKLHTNGGKGGGANHKSRGKAGHRNQNRGNAGKEAPQNSGGDMPAGSDGAAQQLLVQNGNVRAERKKRKTCTKACSTGPAPAPVVRAGNTGSGGAYIQSNAFCNAGEHAVSGGFRLFNVDFGTVVQMENAPIENDAGVPIGWTAAIEDSDASKSIAAYVLCVPD